MYVQQAGKMPEPQMLTIKFRVDPSSGEVQSAVMDRKTRQIIREIPSDQQVRIKETLKNIIDEIV